MSDTTVNRRQNWYFAEPDARPFLLVILSALALAAAFAMPDVLPTIALIGAGCGLVASAIIVWFVRLVQRLRRRVWLDTLSRVVAGDAWPSIMTDAHGSITHANRLAVAAFDLTPGTTIYRSLARRLVSAEDALDRLFSDASQPGSTAVETVQVDDHDMTISVHKVARDVLLWRLARSDETRAEISRDFDLPVVVGNARSGWQAGNTVAEGLLAGSPQKDAAGPPVLAGYAHSLLSEDGATSTLVYLPEAVTKPSADDDPLDSLIDGLPVPILCISTDGGIEAANAPARRVLGLDDENLPALYEIVEGLGRSVTDWLTDAEATSGLLKPEFVRATRQDRDVYLQIVLGRVQRGSRTQLIGILNDATELKTLEAQFVQSQKMQAIGQLAGGVAHDFNNLLTAISGHCDLLLLRHDQGDPNYSDLQQIAHNANRAAALVGQLLAFSRKQTLKPQPLDLHDTMSDLTHLLNRLVGEKVALSLRVATLDKVIRADRRQFEQVIMNLVVNARDAMPEGGPIEVTVDGAVLDSPLERDRAVIPAGNYVLVRVRDSGHGIEEEKLPKIFEPFFTTKKTGEGTGLGLSTAYGIVKQTGGFIFADSEVGKGTCFTLMFPAHARTADIEVAAPATRKKGASKAPGGVVLLVEDEAPVRAFASRALRMRGYTVLEAEDAETALSMLTARDLHVDVFVTDVIMPGLDGPSWVREALKTRPDTRVVFVSGYSQDSVAESQARVPNSVFLAKPFSLNELSEVVQAQLA